MKNHFILTLEDGNTVTELMAGWRSLSSEERVFYFGDTKTVLLCSLSVRKIEVFHDDIVASMDVPEGARAYYAIRSESILSSDGKKEDKLLGRVLGVVKDGIVLEEKFIDATINEVVGVKL